MAKEERRQQIWLLSRDFLLDHFRRFDEWPKSIAVTKFKGPPEGSKICGVSYSFPRGCFEVLVEHESFPVVPDGEEAPIANGTFGAEMVFLFRGEDGAFRQAGTAADDRASLKAQRDAINERIYDIEN